jgi:hypothetical protein
MPPIEETSATDAAEEHRGDADDLSEAARQPPDQHLGHHHEPPGDAAARHQHPGEDEEDDGEQREGVDRGQHALDDRRVVDAGQQQRRDDRGGADRKRDRHADRDEGDEEETEQREDHRRYSAVGMFEVGASTTPRQASRMSFTANTMIRKPETGIAG